DRRVEGPQHARGDPQRRRVRHEEQCDRRQHRADQEVRAATAQRGPGAVGQVADHRLHQQAGHGCGDPQPGDLVHVRTQGLEDAADVGVLQGESELDAQEAEAHVPDLPERQARFAFHQAVPPSGNRRVSIRRLAVRAGMVGGRRARRTAHAYVFIGSRAHAALHPGNSSAPRAVAAAAGVTRSGGTMRKRLHQRAVGAMFQAFGAAGGCVLLLSALPVHAAGLPAAACDGADTVVLAADTGTGLEARAIWLDRRTLRWPDAPADARYALYAGTAPPEVVVGSRVRGAVRRIDLGLAGPLDAGVT